MKIALIVIACVVGVVIIFLFPAVFCSFYMAFYNRKKRSEEEELNYSSMYDDFKESLDEWVNMAKTFPYTELEIKSFDNLTLRGRYYEYKKGAITEILFHGYRGSGLRDMSGGVERCFKMGRNAIVVDQRACGRSDGSVITFGVKERKDCVKWAEKAVELLGEDCKIILTGISMGAATVMLASELNLPKNVIGIIADCGYSSTKDKVHNYMGRIGVNPKILYPFVKFSARVLGKFKLEERSPVDALKNSTVPVFIIHGDADGLVPYYMSKDNFNACVSEKQFVTIEGAGHGLCYPVAPERYVNELKEFEKIMLK